ncbi:hypothetical protein FOG50_00096 [Hanseniaspora uvarum]|nr:hypothetical protein FOG50_00096 [Hanseniaspora uvarum]
MAFNNSKLQSNHNPTNEKAEDVPNVSRPKNNSQQTLLEGLQVQNSNQSFYNAYKGSNASNLTLTTSNGSITQSQIMNNPYLHKNSEGSFSSVGNINSVPYNYPVSLIPNDSLNNPVFYSPNPLVPVNLNQFNQTVHFNNPFQQFSDNNAQLYNSNPGIPHQRNFPYELPSSGLKPEFPSFLKYNLDAQKQSPNSLLFSSNFNFGVPKIAMGTVNNKVTDTNMQPRTSLNLPTRSYNDTTNYVDPLSSKTVVFPDKNRIDSFQLNSRRPTINILDDKKIIKHRPLCNLCGKTFSRASSLKTHIFTVHERIKKYQCPYKECNKRFTTNSNMRRHVRIHERSDSK